MTRIWAMVFGAGLLAGSLGIGAQERPAVTGDAAMSALVGVWTLNKDMSDIPGKSDGKGPGGGPPPGGMGGGMPGGGGRGGMGGGMPPGGGGGRGGDRDEMRRAGRITTDLATPAEGLTIVKDGALVMIAAADGRPLKLTADGKEEERLTGDGVIKSKTRWVGEQLVTEERIQDGPKVTRTYTASSDRRQLTITVRVDGGDMSGRLLVHHVFDRKEGSS